MAVTSEWVQPDDYEQPLAFETGRAEFLSRASEVVVAQWSDPDPEPKSPHWPTPPLQPPDGDGLAWWDRWTKMLRLPADSAFGGPDPNPRPRLEYATEYRHLNAALWSTTNQDHSRTFDVTRTAHERWLTLWTPFKPAPPIVRPEEIPEGASVEYEGGARYLGETVWTVRWGGINFNSANRDGYLGGPTRWEPEWGGPASHWPPDDFRLHKFTANYPTSPSMKPSIESMAMTQPIVDSLTAYTTATIGGDETFTQKTTVVEQNATIAGQLCLTVRPPIWDGTGAGATPREFVTDQQSVDWKLRPSSFVSERVGRIIDVQASQWVRPPRYRFVWPGGQYRLRQRQTLPGSDGWPLRQRQNGAHSGSWPLRQRQSGV